MTNNKSPRFKLVIQIVLALLLSLVTIKGYSVNQHSIVCETKTSGCFALFDGIQNAPIIIDSNDYKGVMIAAENLKSDVTVVSSTGATLIYSLKGKSKLLVVVGTVGHSRLIDELIAKGKLDITEIKNKWESSITLVVKKPFKGVEQALVIAGSDKRGTIFGIYNLSEQIGVSPWYWWADVPVEKKNAIYIKPDKFILSEPAVKYRGIFINDEAPALSGWANEKFGGFNHQFYGHVFELILRLKGNYLWPAMWGSAFYDDDSLNAKLADEYGVVIGTSHHEPMMRAHDEWRRYGSGPWNYDKNAENLNKFWKEGIVRMGDNESLVTVGMRGDGDEPMTEGTAIALLENIVSDQREIIEKVTGKPANKTPQVWALYKEVQDYYDKGMRVPDDVTLLLCDDNWGNLRIVPNDGEKIREGGYGIYYHFDFVGGPRNYKWLNTTQIERVWEQMHLAYEYGVDKLWLVNVGDIKPMELPISFFLDYAWDPDAFTADQLPEYYTKWATEQFGSKFSHEIGELLALYTKYNSRRKPEMLAPGTYSLVNYREADRVVDEYNTLAKKADSIYRALDPEYKDAYYQLVLFPIEACANLNELYVSAAKNKLYTRQLRTSANFYAQRVYELFDKDSLLTMEYHSLGNGRWDHIMSQTHIGYTNWQQPDYNNVPEVSHIAPMHKAWMGIAVEGSENGLPDSAAELVLPEFDPINDQSYYIELFNQGDSAGEFTITPSEPWIKLSETKGLLTTDKKILVSIDWKNTPKGTHKIPVIISGPGNSKYSVFCEINNPDFSKEVKPSGFIENNGVIAIEAAKYDKAVSNKIISWLVIPNLGRTGSAITTMPVTIPRQEVSDTLPMLEYTIYVFDTGMVGLTTYLSPTLNFLKTDGLYYAISIDNEEPQLVNIHLNDTVPDWKYPEWWNTAVGDNCIKKTTRHKIDTSGIHVVKYRMIDPGIDLQRIVLEFPEAGSRYSYLGPEESRHIKN